MTDSDVYTTSWQKVTHSLMHLPQNLMWFTFVLLNSFWLAHSTTGTYFKILLILHEGVTFGCTTFVNLGNKLAAEAAARPKLTAHVRYVWLHALQPFMMQILWPMALNRHQFALCLFNTPNL